MISMKRLVEMARKWQKKASQRRKRISSNDVQRGTFMRRKSAVGETEKGRFVAYAADGKRYTFPLAYLQTPILQELLKMAEEEFGLNVDGAITLPFDSVVMDYITSLLYRGMSKQVEDALLVSLNRGRGRCLSSTDLPQTQYPCHHLPLEGF